METFRGKIRDLSSMGLGVVDHPEGRVFFVKGTWPGDEGEFVVESREKKYGFATILKLDKLSEDREAKPCPHMGFELGQCGGCSWMGIKYEAQLKQKQKTIEYLMKRFAPTANAEIKKVIPSDKVFAYRNRAQLKTDGEKLGYVSPGSKVLAPISSCIILTEHNQKTLTDLYAQLPNRKWKPQAPYLWSFIDIDESVTAENMVPNQRTNFRQANDGQNVNMRNWLKEKLLPLEKNQTVLELFCGSGNFTEVISQVGFEKIVASEMNARAVAELEAKNFPHVTGYACDLFREARWGGLIAASQNAETLVLDPPREGFQSVEKFVANFPNLRRIFYISCEPNRFFTEARLLQDKGWPLKEVQPIDQFPQTPHIELLAVFEK